MTYPHEPVFDDTVCFYCHKKLPEDPQEGTPAFDGFCSDRCLHTQIGKDRALHNVPSGHWEEDLARSMKRIAGMTSTLIAELMANPEPEKAMTSVNMENFRNLALALVSFNALQKLELELKELEP